MSIPNPLESKIHIAKYLSGIFIVAVLNIADTAVFIEKEGIRKMSRLIQFVVYLAGAVKHDGNGD